MRSSVIFPMRQPKPPHREMSRARSQFGWNRAKTELQVKIEGSDILGVLLGASKNGETSVQVLVKPTAKIGAVKTGATADFVLQPIRDSNLFHFRPPVNVIFIDPQLAKKLTAIKEA